MWVGASSSLLFSLKFFCLLFRFCSPCWAEPRIHSPRAGLSYSGRRSPSFNELRELRHQWIHSADIPVYLIQTPSVPLCVEIKSASLQKLWSVTPCVIFCSSPLPSSSEPSSIVGLSWPVTVGVARVRHVYVGEGWSM